MESIIVFVKRLAGLFRQGIPCLFYCATGIYCPGCGGTRAVKYLLKGEILKSFFGGIFGDSDWNRNWENDILSFRNETDIQRLEENSRALSYGSLCRDSNYTGKLGCEKLGFAGIGSGFDSLKYDKNSIFGKCFQHG